MYQTSAASKVQTVFIYFMPLKLALMFLEAGGNQRGDKRPI
jgi:hypothetical protein